VAILKCVKVIRVEAPEHTRGYPFAPLPRHLARMLPWHAPWNWPRCVGGVGCRP
jgi:hypothetical protein